MQFFKFNELLRRKGETSFVFFPINFLSSKMNVNFCTFYLQCITFRTRNQRRVRTKRKKIKSAVEAEEPR